MISPLFKDWLDDTVDSSYLHDALINDQYIPEKTNINETNFDNIMINAWSFGNKNNGTGSAKFFSKQNDNLKLSLG